MLRYEHYQYLWPPRPDVAMAPGYLAKLESEGYVAQYKKNGTNTVLAVRPSTGEIIAKTRHAEAHKNWAPDKQYLQPLLDLPGDGWYVFVAELLHSKVPGIRDVLYIHDILVYDGDYLVGIEQGVRHLILQGLFKTHQHDAEYSHWKITDKIWIARQFAGGFKTMFDEIEAPEDEGLVLKLPDQPLKIASKQNANNGGLVKVRKPHKNFSF